MPNDDARPVLSAVQPQLFVTDLRRALAFYGRLGFGAAFVYGDPPFYAQVVRDGVKLNLRHVDGPVIDRSAGEDLLSASITVDHAGRLFAEYRAHGLAFQQTLDSEGWHAPGEGAFVVADPDGNLLLFVGATD